MALGKPWSSLPRSIRWLLIGYLISTLAVAAYPPLLVWLGLASPMYDPPTRMLRVLTYPFVMSGLNNWAGIALLTWLPAAVLKDRLPERDMLFALVAGSVVGGIAFGLFTSDQTLIGGGLAAWGLIGASLVVSFRNHDTFRGWRRVYQVAAVVVLVGTVFLGKGYDYSFLAAAVGGGLTVFVRTKSGISKRPAANFA